MLEINNEFIIFLNERCLLYAIVTSIIISLMTSNAVDRLLTVSLQTASGIVSLDATGLQTDTRNTLSSYPPATKRKTNVNYYNEDSKQRKIRRCWNRWFQQLLLRILILIGPMKIETLMFRHISFHDKHGRNGSCELL